MIVTVPVVVVVVVVVLIVYALISRFVTMIVS